VVKSIRRKGHTSRQSPDPCGGGCDGNAKGISLSALFENGSSISYVSSLRVGTLSNEGSVPGI
jgi:hypothetical protein